MAADLRMALMEVERKTGADDTDFPRDGVRALAQAVMEREMTQQVGAERHERSPARSGQRNGYRTRDWDTRVGSVGSVEPRVPRVRDGDFFPALLEPRKRAERAVAAVVAVVQEA